MRFLKSAMFFGETSSTPVSTRPFAGSGTTGVAAVRLGRSFVGWERNPSYAADARARLAATHEQLELFTEVTPSQEGCR